MYLLTDASKGNNENFQKYKFECRERNNKKYGSMKHLFTLTFFFFYCLSVIGQTINESETKYISILPDGSYGQFLAKKYNVINNDSTLSILFFIEEENTTLSKIELVRRKLLRRYGDFRLSMLAWEPYMIIENGVNSVPELFVKLIRPGESFDIIFILKDYPIDTSFDILPGHLLLCKEKDLCDQSVGLNYFISAIEEYNFGFPYSFVIIDSESFSRFINKDRQ